MDNVEVEQAAMPELELIHLEGGERAKLKKLVSRFSQLFDEKPGFCHIVAHSIDTGSAPPARSKPYRYDRVKEDVFEQHIKKILDKEAENGQQIIANGDQFKPYYSRTDFQVLNDFLQDPGSASRTLMSPSPSGNPPATKGKQAESTEESPAKRTQQQPQGLGSAKKKRTKKRKVPLQQKKVPMVKRKKPMDSIPGKRPTLEHKPTTSKEAKGTSERRIAKAKSSADVIAVPLKHARNPKRRFKDPQQRSRPQELKRRPEFKNPQPIGKSASFIDKGKKTQANSDGGDKQPRRRLQVLKYPTFEDFCLIRMDEFR
ncbi:hypothetical protein X975_06526, partial [Stegodyphus mimosarum]